MNVNINNMKHNYTSDFFRCCFTIIVVLHHLGVNWIHNGYLAVEFFFILSGYFLIQTFEMKKLSPIEYIKGRIKKLYPHYLFSLIILSVFYYIIAGNYSSLDDLFKLLPEILLIQNIGIFKGGINYPLWYLSVLIISGYFIYYLIDKDKEYFVRFIAPICVIFIYTFLIGNMEKLESWQISGFIYLPLIRGIGAISIGTIIYEICKITNKSQIRSIYIYIFEIISLIGIIYILTTEGNYDGYGIIFITFLIYSCFYNKSIIYKVFNFELYGKISKYMYPIYLNHGLFTCAYPKIKVFLGTNISLIVTISGLILYSITTHRIISIYLKNKLNYSCIWNVKLSIKN